MELKVTTREFFQLMGVLLVCFCQTVCATPLSSNKFLHSKSSSTVVVSNSGNDSADCWENSSFPCASLQFALLKPNLNNTLVIMNFGTHNLSGNIVLENVHNFSLHGENLYLANNSLERKVGIKCVQGSIGISFKLCSNLDFGDFEMSNCSGEHLSTSRSVPEDPRKSNFSLVWTAMYFERCVHISARRINLANNVGMGAVMYDVGGTVYFENMTFERNIERKYYFPMTGFSPASGFIPGLSSGGGLYIDFSFRSLKDPSRERFVSNSQWIFNNCNFIQNTAEHNYSYLSVEDQNYMSFGRGGGISIMVRGNATNNKFFIDGCRFIDNVALWGAGLFLEFHDNALNNTMTVSHSYFQNNSATYAGGGIRIGTTLQLPSTGNTVTIRSSRITRNRAKVGGGFSQYRLSDSGKRNEMTQINNCTFDTNFAVIGSAINLIFTHMHCINSNITGNMGCSFDEECNDMIGQGSIYCGQSELSFRGNNELKQNQNSAIVLDTSQASIHDNLTFLNNSGLDGGAVALYGYSTVRLTRYSQIDFINNTASKKGGAIYFGGAGPPLAPFKSTEFIMYNYSCFIILGDRDTDDADPDKFPARVNFISNVASPSSGNAIFATSVAGCRRWGDPKYNNSVLRWNISNFSQNMEPAIVTGPVKIETDRSYWKAVPGVYFKPGVILRDEHWNSVFGTIRVTVKYVTKGWVRLSGSNVFVVKDKITGIALRGTENAKFSVLLETVTGVPVQYWIYNITLGSCPLGFYGTENGRCECLALHRGLSNGVTHCSGNDVYILKGRWGNPDKTSDPGGTDFANHVCPKHYCNSECVGSETTDGIDCLFQKKKQCAKHRKWDSVLCGACEDGYSVKLGCEECDICKDYNAAFIVPLIVVMSLFVLFVLVLNINTFPTFLNAYLYSYQIIPLLNGFKLPGQHYDPFISIVAGLSGLAGTGDAKLGVCLWHDLTSIQKIAFNYFVPAYIILFTAGVTTLSAYWERRDNVGRKVQKLRRCLFDTRASLHAFAIIAVVVYSDITRITLMLLCPSKVGSKWVLYYAGEVGFFSGEHLPYAICAFIIAFFIVLCFPIIVMRPSLVTGHFTRLTGIFDALQECFQKELRLFSGFYFICRLGMLLTFVYTGSNALRNFILLFMSIIFVCGFAQFRPYEDDSMNTYDLILLTNVSVIAGLNAVAEGLVESYIRNVLLIWAHVHVYFPFLGLLGHLVYLLYQKCQERRQGEFMTYHVWLFGKV